MPLLLVSIPAVIVYLFSERFRVWSGSNCFVRLLFTVFVWIPFFVGAIVLSLSTFVLFNENVAEIGVTATIIFDILFLVPTFFLAVLVIRRWRLNNQEIRKLKAIRREAQRQRDAEETIN